MCNEENKKIAAFFHIKGQVFKNTLSLLPSTILTNALYKISFQLCKCVQQYLTFFNFKFFSLQVSLGGQRLTPSVNFTNIL